MEFFIALCAGAGKEKSSRSIIRCSFIVLKNVLYSVKLQIFYEKMAHSSVLLYFFVILHGSKRDIIIWLRNLIFL